ncbi:MAG: VTC domain-containing protein [Planctomycetota bacterium]
MSIQEIHKEHTRSESTVVPIRMPGKSSASNVAGKYLDRVPRVHTVRKDSMLSCRYELKYRIQESKARAIARYIQSYVSADQYCRKCPDYQYPISSLYFDSKEFHLCRETIERKVNRLKLRVRCYDDNPDSPCFFEIKRRLNRVILKDRARLPKSSFSDIIQAHRIPEDLHKKDIEVLHQFLLYVQMLQARPVVLVRYMRQAFEDNSCNRLRVTFDRKLSFKAIDYPVITTNGSGWQRIPMGFVILEIKFNNQYPAWLSDMIKIFDLKQTAMSKYVSSVKESCFMGFCGIQCHVGG